MVLSSAAIADGVSAAQAVSRVLQTVPLPQVAPRQRATGGFIPAAATPAPQASTANYTNGAHAAPAAQQGGQFPSQQAGQPRQSGNWAPPA
jgi:MoxR-like ATPase